MSELLRDLKRDFRDEAYRNAYTESLLDSFIAAQIKVLREQRDWTQSELAERVGTKQGAISRLENVNYSAWKVDTLKKLARAFRVRLRISFEEYGSLPDDISGFNREGLKRRAFEADPVFADTGVPSSLFEIGNTPTLPPVTESETDRPPAPPTFTAVNEIPGTEYAA